MDTPQRIFYPCTVAFPDAAVFSNSQGGVFPHSDALLFPLSALTAATDAAGLPLPAALAEFELVAGADPYFANFTFDPQSPTFQNAFYLSNDLRVFTVTPGINPAPVAGVTLSPATAPDQPDTGAGYAYIQELLTTLNSSPYNDPNAPSAIDPFTLLPDQSGALTGNSSVTPNSIDPSSGATLANYNFAVARVRLTDTGNTTISNVRVFFRLFVTDTGHTDYSLDSYPSNNDTVGQPMTPLLGADNVTIPFFATGNYENNADFHPNNDYPASPGTSVNTQNITVPAGGTAWAYYGCY